MAIVSPQVLLVEWNKNNGPQESLSKLYSEGLQQYWDWMGDAFYPFFGKDDFGLAVAEDLPDDATSEELKYYTAAHNFAAKLNFLNTEIFDKERTPKGLNLADSSWPGTYLGGTPTEDEPIVYDYAYYKAEVVPVFVQIIEDLKVMQENIFYSMAPNEMDKYFGGYPPPWDWFGMGQGPPENIGQLIDGVIDSAPGFLKLFGINISLAKDIPPLPDTTALGPAPIFSDINLENSINFSIGNTNHYIGFLLDPKKSNGKRENSYLPVRLSPGNDPQKLALGWADPKYSLINQKGEFSNPSNKNKSLDGIEIPLGLEITVVEIVPSETGMWVGFVSEDPKLLDQPVTYVPTSEPGVGATPGTYVIPWEKITQGQRRLLYTKAEYVRIKEGAIYSKPDPYISEKAIVGVRSSAVGQSVESAISIKGMDPVNPLEGQEWVKIRPNDVRMRYFSFDKFNVEKVAKDKKKENLFYNTDTLNQVPTLKLSEGYFYFITGETPRKSEEEIIQESSSDIKDSQEQINLAKLAEATASLETIKQEAWNNLLSYFGKNTTGGNTNIRNQIYKNNFVLVDKKLTTDKFNPNNQKALYAVRASYIDSLPDDERPYSNAFNQDSPFYNGKNYAVALKLKDVKSRCDALADKLKKLKTKIDSSDTNIQNSSGLAYEIDIQIDLMNKFPVFLDNFLARQSFPSSTNQSFLHDMILEGTSTSADHLIQIGIKDNKQIGGEVRETISYVIFSPDPELLKDSATQDSNLFYFDPYITPEETRGDKLFRRSGIPLKVALPKLREEFEGVYGSRTLHLFLAHDKIKKKLIEGETDLENSFMDFMSKFLVPPVKIYLSKNPSLIEPEELDCKELIEKLNKSGPNVGQEEKILQEKLYSSPECMEMYYEQFSKPTHAGSPDLGKKQLEAKSELGEAKGKIMNNEFVRVLYTQFFNVLDTESLIAMIMACLGKALGIKFTAEGICEAAIKELAKSLGTDAIETAMYVNALMDPESVASIDFLAAYQGAPPFAPDLEDVPTDAEGINLDSSYNETPIAASLAMRGELGMVTKTVHNMEKAGVTIKLVRNPRAVVGQTINIPPGSSLYQQQGTSTDLPETYTEKEISLEKQRFMDKGYSEKEAAALLIQMNFLSADPNQYEPHVSGDDFSTPLDKISKARTFDETVKADPAMPGGLDEVLDSVDEWLLYMKNLLGIQGICELLVGDLLDGLKDLIRDPGAFFDGGAEGWWEDFVNKLKRAFSPPSMTFKFPDNLMTDSHMGNYEKELAKAILTIVALILAQIMNLLIKQALERCLEEDEDMGPAGRPANRPDDIPLPVLEASDLPNIGNMLAPDIVAWMKALIDELNNNAKLCALLRGDATGETLRQCLAFTKEKWPVVYENGVDTIYEIRAAFEKIGRSLDLDICDFVASSIPVPLIDDLCAATFDVDSRCLELQKAGLSEEECQEQIDREIEGLRNQVVGLTTLSLFNINPFANASPAICGENGSFNMPPGVRDTMERITNNMLTTLKGSLMIDMNGLKFFSTPPRALLAMSDPSELEKVHSMFATAITDPYKRKCLSLVCDPKEFVDYYITATNAAAYTGVENIQALSEGLHEIYPITYNIYSHYGNLSTFRSSDKDFDLEGLSKEQQEAAFAIADSRAQEFADERQLFLINEKESSIADAMSASSSPSYQKKGPILVFEQLYADAVKLRKDCKGINPDSSSWDNAGCPSPTQIGTGTADQWLEQKENEALERLTKFQEFVDKILEDGPISQDTLDLWEFEFSKQLWNGPGAYGEIAHNWITNELANSWEHSDDCWTEQYNGVIQDYVNEELEEQVVSAEKLVNGALSGEDLGELILTDEKYSEDVKNYWNDTVGLKKPIDFFDRKELLPLHLGLCIRQYNSLSTAQLQLQRSTPHQEVRDFVTNEYFTSFWDSADFDGDAWTTVQEINTKIDEEFTKETKSIYLDKLIVTPEQLFSKYGDSKGGLFDGSFTTNTKFNFPGNVTPYNKRFPFLRKAWPLTTKLKDISNSPMHWYVMLRNYTGLDLSPKEYEGGGSRVFPKEILHTSLFERGFDPNDPDSFYDTITQLLVDEDTGSSPIWTQVNNMADYIDPSRPEANSSYWYNWIRMSPGLRNLMPIMYKRQLEGFNDTYPECADPPCTSHNIAFAFMDLTIAEATGLEIERIKNIFPGMTDIFSLEETSMIFSVSQAYQTEVIKKVESFQNIQVDEFGNITEVPQDIIHSGVGFEQDVDGDDPDNIIVGGHPARYGIHPFYLVHEKPFRDPDLIFNKDPNSMIDYFSMDKDLVNKELYSFLTSSSVAGFTGDSPSRQSDLLLWYGHNIDRLSNFNPNILRYDMPFSEFNLVGKGYIGKNLTQEITKIFSDANGADQIAGLASALDVTQKVISMVNQHVALPQLNSLHAQANEIFDTSHFLKGKINTAAGDIAGGIPPAIVPDENRVSEPTYNFGFIDKHSSEIKNIIDSLYPSSNEENLVDRILKEYKNSVMSSNAADQGFGVPVDLPDFTGIAASILQGKGAQNPYKLDGINFKAQIFGKFITDKFFEKFEDIYKINCAGSSTWITENKDVFKENLQYFMSTYAYSGLQYAYSSQMFSKLKHSRLHERGFMKKLWKKILKSPLTSDIDPRCQQIFDELGAPSTRDLKKTETDFFELDKIKPKIMEFYKNSLCADLYEKSSDQENSSRLSLIEGMVMLLAKIYTLEMCMAALISWDSFEIEDVLKDDILVNIIIQNISEDFDIDDLSFFANDIIKKQEDQTAVDLIKNLTTRSSLKYIISEEAKQISSTIKGMFSNSYPLNTSLQLDILKNSDADFVELYKQEIIDNTGSFPSWQYAALHSSGGFEYVLDGSFKNNIYTMNYGPSPKNAFSYPSPDLPVNNGTEFDIFGEYPQPLPAGEPGNRDGPSIVNRKGNKNYLHSPLLNYYHKQTPAIVTYPTNDIVYTGQEAHDFRFYENASISQEDMQYVDWQRQTIPETRVAVYQGPFFDTAALESRLEEYIKIGDLKHKVLGFKENIELQNYQEVTPGTNLNIKLGNVIFQPYIRIIDYEPGEERDFVAPIYVDPQGAFTEPCEGSTLFQNIHLDDFLAELAGVMSERRADNNMFNCHIYGVVPTEIWSYFYTERFMKKILSYELENGVKPLYELYKEHGLKPFFKKISYGLRMVYTTGAPFGMPGLGLSEFKENAFRSGQNSDDDLGSIHAGTGINPLKEEKCLFSQRANYLHGNVVEWDAPTGHSFEHLSPSKHSFVLKELQIPIVEIEKEVNFYTRKDGGMPFFSVEGGHRGDLHPLQELGWWSEETSTLSTETILPEAGGDPLEMPYMQLLNGRTESAWHLTKDWNQYFYKNLANDMLDDLKNSSEFKMMFEYFFPMTRYMALPFIVSSDALTKFIPEPTLVLEETKRTLKMIMRGLLAGGDYQHSPDPIANFLQDLAMRSEGGTTGKEPDLTKEILKILYKTPLLILKGFVEVTDPAIIVAKLVIDIANMIIFTTIAAIKTGVQIAKQTIQIGIDLAKQMMMQLEIQIGISVGFVDMAIPPPFKEEPPAVTITKDGPLEDWKFEIDEERRDEVLEEVDEDIKELWEDFEEQFKELQELQKDYIKAQNKLKKLQAEKIELENGLEKKVKKAEEDLKVFFKSPYLLPGMWAALFPSMIPMGGGIVPPPFPGGPFHSTVPGMIYLALLLIDAIEEKTHDDMQKTDDANCEEQL